MNMELSHIHVTKILKGNSDLENPDGTELIIDLEVDRLFVLPCNHLHLEIFILFLPPPLC